MQVTGLCRTAISSLIGASILLAAANVTYSAQWDVTLDKPVQSGTPGTPIVFSGTITNTTGAELFLDTGAINFSSSAAFTKDYEDSFLSLLGIIPTTGYSGPLFYIDWGSGATPGSSGTGTFVLTVPAPISPSSISVDFQASVPSTTITPEGSSLSLIALGCLLLAVTLCNRGLLLRNQRR